MTEIMRQTAPYPDALAHLVKCLRYRQHMGWRVWLEDDLQRDKPGRHAGESRGMTLVVQRHGPDTYHPPDPDVVEDALIAVAKVPGDLAVLQALVRRGEAVAARQLRDRARPGGQSRVGGLERDPHVHHATYRHVRRRRAKGRAGGSRFRLRRTKEAMHARRLLRGESAGRGG